MRWIICGETKEYIRFYGEFKSLIIIGYLRTYMYIHVHAALILVPVSLACFLADS